jgi:hypothetical protein
MQSSEYLGSHKVQVTATDGAGHVTTKELSITINKDVTPPKITTGGEAFFTQPQNWLVQKTYAYSTEATDVNASGVASFQFKIDGLIVKQAYGPCPGGSCAKTLTGELNVLNYTGGAHSAELVATDIAGNVAKKTWTINVDPEGHIAASEATDTLEAVEETAPETTEYLPVEGLVTKSAASEEQPTLIATETGFKTEGAPTETTIGQTAAEGFSYATSGFSESETEHSGTVTVVPVGTTGGGSVGGIAEESAAVFPNSQTGGDTVIRPAYDGIMAFQDIRDPSASESYTWAVRLSQGEQLKLIDEQHARVFWEDGTEATLITAQPAHDANGTTVRTTLSVSGNLVTETVHYKEQVYVYPIVAGVGWEGGFQTVEGHIPPTEQSGEEVEESGREINAAFITEWSYSAPEPATLAEAAVDPQTIALEARTHVEHRRFRYIGCHEMDDTAPPYRNNYNGEVNCGNPFIHDTGSSGIAFNYGIGGSYFRLPGVFAKHTGSQTEHIECAKTLDKSKYEQVLIEARYFITEVKCEWHSKTKEGEPVYAPYGEHITPYGEWNWGLDLNSWDGPWTHQPPIGLALYIWAAKSKNIGRHETTCIDCS